MVFYALTMDGLVGYKAVNSFSSKVGLCLMYRKTTTSENYSLPKSDVRGRNGDWLVQLANISAGWSCNEKNAREVVAKG